MTNNGPLLDVNLVIACAWTTHPQHDAACLWLDQLPRFSTCAITQMGFLRVSMSAAFGASYDQARLALSDLTVLPTHRFVSDDASAADLPPGIESRQDITDAHLLAIASRHHLILATLDDALCRKPWAEQLARNPLV